MKTYITQLLALFVLMSVCSACQTTAQNNTSNKASIMKSYLSSVSKYNGIDEEEAILLAQSELIFRGLDNKYDLKNPHVTFENNSKWAIIFRPISKTFNEFTKRQSLLMMISKKSGEITLMADIEPQASYPNLFL